MFYCADGKLKLFKLYFIRLYIKTWPAISRLIAGQHCPKQCTANNKKRSTYQTNVAGAGAEQLAEVLPPSTAIPDMGCTRISSTVTLTLAVVSEPCRVYYVVMKVNTDEW